MAQQYKVVFSLDPDGVRWNAQIPGKPGGYECVSWGRSLSEARKRIVDALATALDDEKAAAHAVLVPEYRIEGAAALAKLRARREKVEQSVRELADDTAAMARELHTQGFSLRDIADLVGTSHGRIQQWLAK